MSALQRKGRGDAGIHRRHPCPHMRWSLVTAALLLSACQHSPAEPPPTQEELAAHDVAACGGYGLKHGTVAQALVRGAAGPTCPSKALDRANSGRSGFAEHKSVTNTPQPPKPVESMPPESNWLLYVADASAPIAARAAECGYWNEKRWLSEVMQADVRHNQNGAVVERFTDRLNDALTARTGDEMGLSCSIAYNYALDYLSLWANQAD